MSADGARLEYAWNWFSYHASQRFSSFNFFVVFAGGLAVAYMTSVEKGWPTIAAIIGGFGVLISVGFALLDIRNRELVQCAREALIELEKSHGLSILSDSLSRRFLSKKTRFGFSALPRSLQERLTKHGIVFQGLQYVAALLFLIGTVYGILKFRWPCL